MCCSSWLSASWFLASLWSLWPPRNSFQEYNNQISCCSLEPGRTKGGGGHSRRGLAVHRSQRALWGHSKQNHSGAPFDSAPFHKTRCPYLRSVGYAPIERMFAKRNTSKKVGGGVGKHPGPARSRETSLYNFTFCLFAQFSIEIMK